MMGLVILLGGIVLFVSVIGGWDLLARRQQAARRRQR